VTCSSAHAPDQNSAGGDWRRFGSFYQIYPWSFADSNGDGFGDVNGIRSRVSHLEALAIDGVWLSPWFDSPLVDGGYDVADYFSVHPLLGTMSELDALIDELSQAGIGVLFDLVGNHTSSQHPWFREALADRPGGSARQRYHFHPPTADGLPPNDWVSAFGGPAWTMVPDGEWYLHTFDPGQPDLNWDNPEVSDFFDRVIRFWIDRGVRGFRADVAHGLAKDPLYTSMADLRTHGGPHPYQDRDRVHDHIRHWRSVLDSYDNRGLIMAAEAVVPTWQRLARYIRPDEYHQVFNSFFIKAPWRRNDLHREISAAIGGAAEVGALPTWMLSNHDEVRHATRYALPPEIDAADWLLDGDRSLVDDAQGARRARAAALLSLGLPGSHYMYQGEELGLPEVYDLSPSALRDPSWERSGHKMKGRDGCRVPLPWEPTPPSYGFTSGTPWLPIPSNWTGLDVRTQETEVTSTLNLYRSALQLRRTYLRHDDFRWIDHDGLAFQRGNVTCVVNIGPSSPVSLPKGELLISSEPLTRNLLPSDTAAWIRTDCHPPAAGIPPEGANE
jgi:alpha-glucosidase